MAWVCAISLPLFTLITVAVVPHGKKIIAEKPNWRHLWTAIRENRPLQIFVTSQLLGGMGGGIMLGTQLFMLDSYFHIADKFGLIFVVYGATHFIGMPIWLRIVYRIGKHRAWAASWAISAALGPLVLLFPTGIAALPWMLGFTALRSLISGADIVVPKALMADAVDYGILKTGSNAAGSYYAIWSLGVKMCAAISSGIAFYLLDAFGFNPKPGAINTEIGINGLLFVSLFLPAIFNISAAYCIWRFPIGQKRADIIRKRIEARGLRAGIVLAD
jgi:Na+/melibiose symporter-like transporter